MGGPAQSRPARSPGKTAHHENLTVLLYRLAGTWQLGEKVGLVEHCRRLAASRPNPPRRWCAARNQRLMGVPVALPGHCRASREPYRDSYRDSPSNCASACVLPRRQRERLPGCPDAEIGKKLPKL